MSLDFSLNFSTAPTGTPTLGITRVDTSEVIVAAGTSFTGSGTAWVYSLSSPIAGVTYRCAWSAVVSGATITDAFDLTASTIVPAQASLYGTTLQSLRLAVKQATNKAQDSQLINVDDLINEAIMLFTGLQQWPWRQRTLTLDTVANQNYIDLPAGLSQIDSLTAISASMNARMIAATIDEIIGLRARAFTIDTFIYYYAVSWTPQSSAAGIPIPRLELFPTPSTSVAGAITGYYSRIVTRLVAATDVPDVPPAVQPLLLKYCRIHAMERYGLYDDVEKEKPSFDTQLVRAMQDSGALQRNLGNVRGVGTARRGAVELPVTISYP